MTVMEAITTVDNLKHNTYTVADKIKWLNTLEGRIQTQIIDTHEGDSVRFSGYQENGDDETELLVAAPYDEIYLRWLEAMIDYANGEYMKYNNSIDMFNAIWTDYTNYYNRTHLPKSRKYKFF